MSSGEPFMPLFHGDLLAATAEWKGEERSLYLTLLAHQWSIGSLPVNPDNLCDLIRYTRKNFDSWWPRVSTKFVEEDGRLFNLRLEKHRAKAKTISAKRAVAGAKGGSVAQAKDKQLLDVCSSKTEASASDLYSHPIQPIQEVGVRGLPRRSQ